MTAGSVTPTTTIAPCEPDASAIRVRGLRKVFGATVAVSGVDLDVPAGAVLAFHVFMKPEFQRCIGPQQRIPALAWRSLPHLSAEANRTRRFASSRSSC